MIILSKFLLKADQLRIGYSGLCSVCSICYLSWQLIFFMMYWVGISCILAGTCCFFCFFPEQKLFYSVPPLPLGSVSELILSTNPSERWLSSKCTPPTAISKHVGLYRVWSVRMLTIIVSAFLTSGLQGHCNQLPIYCIQHHQSSRRCGAETMALLSFSPYLF